MTTRAPQTEAPVRLVPYDPSWPALFEAERTVLEGVLRPWLAGTIEHVGSTAVPGLLAILLFAGAYAWLANQPSINRPFVAFGAIGKASAFFVVLLLWLTAEASARSVLAISGDLVLAGLFTWGLVAPGTEAEGDASASPEHT